MTEAEVKREIAIALDYAYLHDDWVEPLDVLLASIDAERARWKPTPDAPSIWEIVLHLAVWNENIVTRIERGDRFHPDESWPVPPQGGGESEWQAAQARLRDSYASVHGVVESKPLDTLQGGYGLADLLCRLTHSGYHLGQIVKLREWMAS